MAKTRVHDLAKEFGITSKEMLAHLADMKIPAKSPSSALEDAYVAVVRKQMAPILKAHAAEIEAAKKAEAEQRAQAEAEERTKAEATRVEAEKRREAERAREALERAEAERKRKQAEEERLEAERKRKEEEERNRIHDNAPKSVPSMTSLLDQIAQQESVLKKRQETTATTPAKPEVHGKRGPAAAKAAPTKEATSAPATPEKAAKLTRGKRKGHHEGEGDDHYSRMAKAAEQYNRERILEDVRTSVAEASRASTGRRKKRKERRQQQAAEAAHEQAVEQARANDQNVEEIGLAKVPTGSTVAELADLLGVPASDIVKRLFLLGTPLTMTQSMSDDLIELVADDLGREVKIMSKEEENSFTFYDDPADLVSRPPVVTVMGHVDHGKTSLLDAIRHTGVAEGEAGGITQAIGASQVTINGRPITFIDTPGHETFTAMRARGAKVTDIVILIVAADDGVMPQTVESIHHARAANVPIIVAVNKIDKPGANPDKVRQELTEYEVVPEEWGGQNMFVNISAKKKIGIDDLLETVLLQADVLELKANPNTFASGNVLEAKLDRGRGSLATVLVTRGTLHIGDALVAGMAHGRVRAMLDAKGNPVKQALPSDPVEIVGLQSVPAAGDEFRVFTDERDARDLAEQRSLKARIEEQSRVKHVTLETLFSTMENSELKELNLVIKADVQGSIEALRDSLDKMDQSEVHINTIHSAVGAITETDVTLADASNAIIIGFGVRPDAKARTSAEREGVEIRTYSVIYKAIEDIDAARIGMLKPTEKEVPTGSAEVRDTFKVPKVGIAAGCMVSEGELSRDDNVRLVRDGIVVFEGKIASMRRFKDDVKSVKAGFECGIGLENFQDIHPGDVIEGYKVVEVARTE